jgi:hypothetical protein
MHCLAGATDAALPTCALNFGLASTAATAAGEDANPSLPTATASSALPAASTAAASFDCAFFCALTASHRPGVGSIGEAHVGVGRIGEGLTMDPERWLGSGEDEPKLRDPGDDEGLTSP